MLIIWHNPRCSKSRQTLALIEASGKSHTIRRYLDDRPNAEEIDQILRELGFEDPKAIMRKGEAIYKDLDLKSKNEKQLLIEVMAENAILIERPIVTNGKKAIIGRPPEAVLSLLR